MFGVFEIEAGAEGLLAGADMSHLAFFEQRQVLYQDAGQTRDALELLKGRGLTCVRLRLFTSSDAQAKSDPYNYINNLAYTLPLARRVKQAGLQFLLDFHYSDTWADPAHQAKPAAWAALSFSDLVSQMRQYTSNCVAAFEAVGARPDFVQVGNEITSGLLWPDGRVGGSYDTPTQWSRLGQLLKAAIQGITDAGLDPAPQVIIHLDRGGDWSTTQWFFDNLQRQGVSFDIIGQSYYPFWHGPLRDLTHCLAESAQRYGKPLMVVETAFPWTNSYWPTNFLGWAPNPSNQVQFVAALARALEGLPGRLGHGVFWWGTEFQKVAGVNEAGFYTASLFDSTGNVLPAAQALGQLAAPFKLDARLEARAVVLTWPLSGALAVPVVATNLAPDATWLPVTNPPSSNTAPVRVDLPVEPGSFRFYRLVAP